MEIRFKKISLKNFCGVKDFETDLYDRTIIKGVNQSGKSTIKNAIYWVLFDKLANGNSADGIRPRDEEGNDIDLIDIEVILTLDADGKEVEIKKTQKQDWVKDRTTQQQKFKGNVNEFEINGIPKTAKAFYEYMEQFIDLDLFLAGTNPYTFLRLDTKKRRQVLFDLVGDVDQDIIGADDRFREIEKDLMDGTVDELIIRSRKAISAYKDELKEIPARIDEVNQSIVELSDEEIEILSNTIELEESRLIQIEENSKCRAELVQRISNNEIALKKLESEKVIAQQKAEANANIQKSRLEQEIAIANGKIGQTMKEIENARARQADMETLIKKYSEDIETVKAETFDGTNLKCPVCGRKYTESKIESLKKTWQDSQDKKIEQLQHLADDTVLRHNEIEDDIAKFNEDIVRLQADITQKQNEAAFVGNMPAPVEVEDHSEEIANLKASIEADKAELDKMAVESGADKQESLNKIADCKAKLKALDTNEAFRQRIAELTQEQLKVSQKIADQERMLDLLTDYQRAKIDLITESINKYFDVIKWRFFKPQINGGYQEVCEPLVNGVSMDGLLNHGDRILAEIDLCRAFQKKAEVKCPIIIDDTESLDSWRVPEIDSQLITIRRTDDKSLTIESLA